MRGTRFPPRGVSACFNHKENHVSKERNEATYLAALYLQNCSISMARIHNLIDDNGNLNPTRLAKEFHLQSVDPEEETPGVFGNILRLEVPKADLQGVDWADLAADFTYELKREMKTNGANGTLREILSSHAEIQGNVVRITKQLSRQEYLLVAKPLTDLGGKWSKAQGGIVFDEDPSDLVDAIILTGTWQKNKDMDFFATPDWLAETMVSLALIQPGMRVFEPHGGSGAIANQVREQVPLASLQVGELSDKRRAQLIADGYDVVATNFLDYNPGRVFHRIIMNPPFSKQQDIDHFMHATQLIVPGGRIVSVMPSSITFRNNNKTVALRDWLEEHNGQIHDNPEKAFAASGTNVRTVTVTADI